MACAGGAGGGAGCAGGACGGWICGGCTGAGGVSGGWAGGGGVCAGAATACTGAVDGAWALTPGAAAARYSMQDKIKKEEGFFISTIILNRRGGDFLRGAGWSAKTGDKII